MTDLTDTLERDAQTDNRTIGDNQPPADYVLLEDEIARYLKTADLWIAERPKFLDADMAEKAEDFLTQLRALDKKVGENKEIEARPLMNALDMVRARYKVLADRLSGVTDLLKSRKTAWLTSERDRIAEEKRVADEEARLAQERAAQAQQEADELIQQANAGELQTSGVSVTGKMEEARLAQEKAAQAQTNAKVANETKATVKGALSTKTSGLKTYHKGAIVDNAKLLAWVKKNRADELMAFLQGYADRAARSPEMRKSGLPGVEFKEEQRA